MITEFGKLLKIIRIKTGDSVLDMANKLHISKSYLTSIENGSRRIPNELINVLFSVYPLTEKDKENIRETVVLCTNMIKINLDNYSDEEKRIILNLVKKESSKDKIHKIFDIINEK